MATKANVLIETPMDKTKDVLSVLQKMKGVREADTVTREYDIVAVVEVDDLNSIGELVTRDIHTIGGIHRTTTYLSVSM